MGTKTIIALVSALTFGLGACGRTGGAECKAWVEKSVACDVGMKTASVDERARRAEQLQQICVEEMGAKGPHVEGESAYFVCAQKTSCDDFNACEAAADK